MGAGAGFPRPFGPYTLLCELGRGGMGETYLARSRGLEGIAKPCVIKTARPDAREADRVRRRFLDELRVVVLLKSPSICPVFDVGEVSGTPYVAMEYISRLNLRQVQDRARETSTLFPEDVAVWICTRVLEGLEHAHTLPDVHTNEPLGIVHRDVSPHNVMVGLDGNVWLIDFGLAQAKHKVEQTETGALMGKLLYMAPEQVRGEEVGPSIDQFATAIMLYELVVGERFYEGVAQHEIALTAGNGGYRPRRWSSLSPALQEVLSTALAPSPSERFDSCRSFSRALLEATRVVPDASRFAELIGALFPGAEEEERQFLASLPEPAKAEPEPSAPAAEVTHVLPRRRLFEEAAAAARADAESHTSTDLLARQWRPKRSRYVLAALGAGGLGLLLGAAVVLRSGESSPTPPAPSTQDPPAASAANENREPGPDRGAGQQEEAEPSLASAGQEPSDTPETAPEPTPDATPEHAAEPTPEPPVVATTNVEPKRVAAKAQTTPKTTRPSTSAERPRATQQKAQPRGRLASTVATLQKCDEGCATFWLDKLKGANEVSDDIRYGVEVCLDRCNR